MKYFAKCLLLLVMSCLVHQTLHAQQRNVVFFYGLGKRATESAAYANAFESSRQITSFSDFNYVTQQTDPQGMVKVADDARVQAAAALGTNVADARNIALGHDIGGLIARRLNNTNPTMFGGLILTGTPNTDMPLVSNFINGNIARDFRLIGIQRAPDVKAPFKLGGQDFGVIPVADIPMKWAEKMFGADPAAVFKSVTDLQKDSRFLRNLGNTRVPTVAIWGNENDPAVWRFFSSVNSAAIGATSLTTSDNSDIGLSLFVMSAANAANTKASNERLTGIFKVAGAGLALFAGIASGGITAILSGAVGAGTGVMGSVGNFENAAKARMVRDWLEKDSKTIWNNLIGATRTEQVNVGVQGSLRESCRQMVNDPNQGWAAYWTVLTPQQRLDCWINEIILQNVQIQEESDGVLHKTTQQFGNVLAPLNRVEARGANHEELLNHTGTTAAYEQVWSGRSDFFFSTN